MPTSLGTIGSVGTRKPAGVTGTARQAVGQVRDPYVGRSASYTGTTAITPQVGGPQGTIGRVGTRAASQAAAAFNAANAAPTIQIERPTPTATEPTEEDLTVGRLDTLASQYNALVQNYRDNPIMTDELRGAMKSYWDALATTPLPSTAARETQLFQEMVRKAPSRASEEARAAQREYFGQDLYGNDYDYERYSPLLPFSQNGTDYYGNFQREYVQRLLDENLIPTSRFDRLAADVAPLTNYASESQPIGDNVPGQQRGPNFNQTAELRFQDVPINVSGRDVYYNPAQHAYGAGGIFYDVFGGRAANSAWGAVSDNGLQDLMFPDAPYTRQGYKGHWQGNGSLNPIEKSADTVVNDVNVPGYTVRNRTIADDVPIMPNPGERQVLNQRTTRDPIETSTEVSGYTLPGYRIPGRTLAQLTPWRQAHGGEVGPINPNYQGRAPMFDVPQNYVAKPFSDTSWEPYAYNVNANGFNIATGRALNQTPGPTLASITNNFENRPIFNVRDPSNPLFNAGAFVEDVTPLGLSRQERLSRGYGE